jgi:ketosteroid isomerase-like protein/quercetin dioxygenase-like cupin family protein
LDNNKQLLERIFAGMEQGDSKLFVESMADDFRWTVSGNSRWSRTYAGKQVVLAELLAPLRQRIAGRVKTAAVRFIAEGDLVAVEARGSNTTKEGVAYNNSYCFVFRVVGGRLTEVTEYMDTQLAAAVLDAPRAGIKPLEASKEFFTPEQCYIIEVSNSADDEAVSIARARVAPGVTTRWHRVRDTAERYVILEGRGRVEVGELAPLEVGPGDVVLIPPSMRQRIANTGKEDLVFLAICTPRFRNEAYEELE